MITFVDIFTINPDKQQDLLRAIEDAYRTVVKHQPGYISARLLKSDDGTKITVVSLWQTQENLTSIKEIIDIQNLKKPELFEAIISNDYHAYTYSVEVPGASHKHKQ